MTQVGKSPSGAARPSAAPSASELRARFESVRPLTVGLEEELVLLDPDTLDLAPRATAVLERLGSHGAAKLELPASQLELVTRPHSDVPAAIAELAAGRAALARAAAGIALPAAAAMHPFASAEGRLNRGERYDEIDREFGWIARRQLVCALQVHVAVGGAERTLAVYNALRTHLPDIAALAAAAPWYEDRDTGFASVRPLVAGMLPRQGLPPALPDWEAFAEELRWGAAAGAVPEARRWWWELRPHVVFGTLELRVPDVQSTLGEAAAIAAVVHSLVAWLAQRHDAGKRLETARTWRIAENRWSAARYGVEGAMTDLRTGRREPTRERLRRLLSALEPQAAALGCAQELGRAHELVQANAAMRLRAAGRTGGGRAIAEHLTARFLEGLAPDPGAGAMVAP